ncbi:MAG: pyridoxal phosphate-dependent aminotransferase family protein [Cyanobacteria bacterium SIG28]|nr:pyridoxal phosphate-dependent aminotransferase family protein [Cyanobacteria bacterium SIG28]
MQRIREELETLKNNGQYRSIPDIFCKANNKIIIEGNEYINFASNDYLSISTNENLRNEFLANDRSFFSSASARLLSGTSKEYKELETTLANLFNKDAALIFNTGYQCNLGVISTLCQKGDIIFSDKLNHASIIDGMRLSEGEFVRYKHLDYDNLETLLVKKRNQYNRAIIISESIFSMDGDVADIDKLIELKNKYNCLLMIDEAHAFCAYGKGLAGVSENKDVDIITATFGKAVGSFGAFCVANSGIINYLINKSRSFIFSTSIPPINIAWTNWLLTEKRSYLLEQKLKLENLVKEANLILNRNGTHIIPVVIGSNSTTNQIAEELKSLGYYIPAIRPPTVPENSSRLRISLTADTKLDDFRKIIDTITSRII